MLAATHSLVGAVRGIFNPVWVLNIFCLIWSVGHAFSAICLPMIFKYGSEKAVREAGRLREEGKEYVGQDGDIMEFRFNV